MASPDEKRAGDRRTSGRPRARGTPSLPTYEAKSSQREKDGVMDSESSYGQCKADNNVRYIKSYRCPGDPWFYYYASSVPASRGITYVCSIVVYNKSAASNGRSTAWTPCAQMSNDELRGANGCSICCSLQV
jgi:hypothetical protein